MFEKKLVGFITYHPSKLKEINDKIVFKFLFEMKFLSYNIELKSPFLIEKVSYRADNLSLFLIKNATFSSFMISNCPIFSPKVSKFFSKKDCC